ncbi:MAG TPA: flavin reductase family protein [Candidatus Binataceae bacterium]|nr:flavin reductase family protein [Candidatus Binataceae bacterium]
MDRNIAVAMANLSTGIYVLTVDDGAHRHGMSSSWVVQVSGTPPLFMAAVDNNHFSRAMLAKVGAFGFNIVGRRGKELEDYFYSARSRRPDNLDGLAYELSPKLKVPWLDRAMISIEARVVDSHVAGDHTIFIAEMTDVRIRDKDEPLTSLDLEYVYIGGKEVVKRE